MRHGPLAFAFETPALHRAPVVVRAPGDAEREPLLERRRARRVVTTERPAGDPDPAGVHIGPRLEPVHGRACSRNASPGASPVVVTLGEVLTGFGTAMLLPTALAGVLTALTPRRHDRPLDATEH